MQSIGKFLLTNIDFNSGIHEVYKYFSATDMFGSKRVIA